MFLIFGHNNPILSLASTFQVLFEFYSRDWAGTGLGLNSSFCHFLHNLFERTRFEYKTGHNTAPRCLHNFYFMSTPLPPPPTLYCLLLLFSTDTTEPIQLIFPFMQNLISLIVADWNWSVLEAENVLW